MATKRTAAAKVAPTVSPDPADQIEGGAPADVFVPDAIEIVADAPEPVVPSTRAGTAPAPGGGTGTGTGTGTPAPAITTPGAARAAGDPHGYASWVVPAPAPLATAAVGTSGYYMGIKAGVDTKTGPFAAWLGTDAPRASWPN